MSKKKLAKIIGVCSIAIMIIVVITILPSCDSATPTKPIVVTNQGTDHTTTSLKAQGEVTGGTNITRRGFYYDTGPLYGWSLMG